MPWALLAYMAGILGALSLTVNPFVGLGLICFCGIAFWRLRFHVLLSWIMLVGFCFFLGLLNMQFHFYLSRHSSLKQALYQTPLTATVLESQPLAEKQILTLGDIHWESPDLKMPQKIKVHFKQMTPLLEKGDRISALVSVYPPNNTFSRAYAYQLWFSRIGATGVVDELRLVIPAPQNLSLFQTRHFINQHLFHILPRFQAEVAAPLMTGEQKLISPETYQIYRRAGIAHVLSVSGFHMALLATFLFFVIRSLCALFPRIVLYYNTKKLAAVVALLGTFLYLGLSGFQVPAIRAFIMVAFVFLGVLIERRVISMRSVMLAAWMLLLLAPYMLLSISFQLSFIAVAVLVVVCRSLSHQAWPSWVKTGVGFLALNLLVSGALTPFILYHFHQWMPYGILGNMLFSALFSFFVMPLLFFGTLLIPLGWDRPFFILAGMGLEGVRWGAGKLAHLPYAEISVPTFSAEALLLLSFGTLLLFWMKTPFRVIGLFPILSGIVLGIWS
ncbi:MAG: ComEC/Rec2 family competence protein [Alphaproteobacteria bacterium]